MSEGRLGIRNYTIHYGKKPLTPEQIAKLEAVLWCDENGWTVCGPDRFDHDPSRLWSIAPPSLSPYYYGSTLAEAVARAREATKGDGA